MTWKKCAAAAAASAVSIVCVWVCVWVFILMLMLIMVVLVLALNALNIWSKAEMKTEEEEVRKKTNGHVIDRITHYMVLCMRVVRHSSGFQLTVLSLGGWIFQSSTFCNANGHHHSSLFEHFNYDLFCYRVADINNDRSLRAPNICFCLCTHIAISKIIQ